MYYVPQVEGQKFGFFSFFFFIYKKANQRRRRNTNSKLKDENDILRYKQIEIQNIPTNYFASNFKASDHHNVDQICGTVKQKVDDSNFRYLQKNFDRGKNWRSFESYESY